MLMARYLATAKSRIAFSTEMASRFGLDCSRKRKVLTLFGKLPLLAQAFFFRDVGLCCQHGQPLLVGIAFRFNGGLELILVLLLLSIRNLPQVCVLLLSILDSFAACCNLLGCPGIRPLAFKNKLPLLFKLMRRLPCGKHRPACDRVNLPIVPTVGAGF